MRDVRELHVAHEVAAEGVDHDAQGAADVDHAVGRAEDERAEERHHGGAEGRPTGGGPLVVLALEHDAERVRHRDADPECDEDDLVKKIPARVPIRVPALVGDPLQHEKCLRERLLLLGPPQHRHDQDGAKGQGQLAQKPVAKQARHGVPAAREDAACARRGKARSPEAPDAEGHQPDEEQPTHAPHVCERDALVAPRHDPGQLQRGGDHGLHEVGEVRRLLGHGVQRVVVRRVVHPRCLLRELLDPQLEHLGAGQVPSPVPVVHAPAAIGAAPARRLVR
mmetsp:Transcript_123110/g.344616  ORF Transcript_123110/g.344616 Transcript_123110/m.344616 type:complete len:280 (-) Transcript_123110:123-962(-)